MRQIFIAVAALVAFNSCGTAPSSTEQSASSVALVQSVDPTSGLTLAYVNVELVLSQSDIFTQEGAKLQQRTETAQREWTQKEQRFQSELAQLSQKYQQGLITTANAQKEQQSIEQRVQEYQTATQKQASELDEENTVFANRTQRLLQQSIELINKDKRYSMIVNASALIDADTTLDISAVVLEELNRLYKEEKK